MDSLSFVKVSTSCAVAEIIITPLVFTFFGQVESIRAQLSATLTAGRFPASNTDLSKSVSISRTTPGLGLTTVSSTPKAGTNGLGEDDIFGDNEGEDHLSLAELERTVEERKRMRPPGMERQVPQSHFGCVVILRMRALRREGN